MTCDHRYVDIAGPSIAWLEIDGKGQMASVDSLSECSRCGDTRASIRLEDGTMWVDFGETA